MSLQLPPSSCCPVGLVYLELMHEQTHLLGGQKGVPLMLLPSAAAAEEACGLLLGSSSAALTASIIATASAPAAPIKTEATCPSPAASTPSSSSSFLLDLGCWLEAAFPTANTHDRLLRLGLRLLCHSIGHGLPGCVTAIMDIIITRRLGITPEELLHSAPMPECVPPGFPVGGHRSIGGGRSIDPPSLSLLHLVIQRGNLPLIHSLLAWAELHSVRPDWTVAGTSGICPLHLAALLPNAEAVVRGMLEPPRPYGPNIAAAWLLCRSSDGRTPAELGSTVGLPASLDSLAHDVLVRAAAEEDASFAIEVNPDSLTESVSFVSDTSGIAAMMTGLVTGDDGVGASREVTEVPPVDRELWTMPETASADKVASGGKAETASAGEAETASGGKAEGLLAAGADCGGHMGRRSGSNSATSSMPESNGAPCSNSSPITFPSYGTGRMEAGHLRLCRLLLLGFPDRSVEWRYAQFKVRIEMMSADAESRWPVIVQCLAGNWLCTKQGITKVIFIIFFVPPRRSETGISTPPLRSSSRFSWLRMSSSPCPSLWRPTAWSCWRQSYTSPCASPLHGRVSAQGTESMPFRGPAL